MTGLSFGKDTQPGRRAVFRAVGLTAGREAHVNWIRGFDEFALSQGNNGAVLIIFFQENMMPPTGYPLGPKGM